MQSLHDLSHLENYISEGSVSHINGVVCSFDRGEVEL